MTASQQSARPASSVFHAITHVWGREYLECFLNVCIPNQLAPGNVDALPAGSRYRILTRTLDVAELQRHPNVHALRQRLPVDVVVVPALDQTGHANGYELMNSCHRQAVDDAMREGAALIFLSADVVLSTGCLAAVVRRHAEGYRAVAVTGLRLAKESFLDAARRAGESWLTLGSRDLVRVAWPHLHAHTRSMFVHAARFTKAPSAVYWPVGDQGLLARCLHLHPLMVDPIDAVPLGAGTADGPYLAQACPDFSKVHVVTDSDELQVFELTDGARQIVGTIDGGAETWIVARVAKTCDALQLGFWQRFPIRIHAQDFDQRWSDAQVEAERFARRVLATRPYADLSRRWFRLVGDIRKSRTRLAKACRRQVRRVRTDRLERWAVRQVHQYRRLMPRVNVKHVHRPVRLMWHQGTKSVRRLMKRVHRLAPRTALRFLR